MYEELVTLYHGVDSSKVLSIQRHGLRMSYDVPEDVRRELEAGGENIKPGVWLTPLRAEALTFGDVVVTVRIPRSWVVVGDPYGVSEVIVSRNIPSKYIRSIE